MQAVMVKMRVQWDQEVFDTCVLQDNVSDIVKEGGVQRLFDGELIVQVVSWCLYVYALCIYFLRAVLFLGL
jgi:hypothetical protein